ncbi:hypothetical protein [Pseudolactococcus reticulitermitis]|uniref:Uncharacterized protein n=1 Tax=Pseudolactococcus reticulitermitis TaxID=2025039 RepID=A0A224XFD7_9LACT|nr:hypothetical protein [Lactococcus reticulitermitis]GAX48271.1 hypothetical protein RsY01_1887 [Lactococcus reticulitermitis]
MYFVTEIDSDLYLGRELLFSKEKQVYFERVEAKLNQEFTHVKAVKLSELYEDLKDENTTEKIILSKYAKAYQHAIQTRYPNADVKNYEE